MSETTRLSDAAFADLCRKLMAGFGMRRARSFEAKGLNRAFRKKLVRESTDKMFRSEEAWLCVFLRGSGPLAEEQARAIADAAIAADVRFLLLVVFGTVPSDVDERLRRMLAREDVEVAVLAGPLAECLAADYGGLGPAEPAAVPDRFSFARLRRHAAALVEEQPWRKHFQTVGIQPGRVVPLGAGEDEALTEADLVRAMHAGSFLLLGEPGAGKTTSLLALGRDLAEAGPKTPVYVPLGCYRGDFWDVLCEALAPGAQPVAKPTAEALVHSGALVVMLDGINEVQHPELQARLADELNRVTEEEEPAARTRWIVSGRVHDYQQAHRHLVHLEAHRWEMQPFTADLIYQLLADTLGKAEGLALYEDLGPSVRELCSNPLLLNMVLTVHQQQGKAPIGRGALYREFVDLLLRWGGTSAGCRPGGVRPWPGSGRNRSAKRISGRWPAVRLRPWLRGPPRRRFRGPKRGGTLPGRSARPTARIGRRPCCWTT